MQVQILDSDDLVIMRFRNVDLATPDSELFKLPSRFVTYESQAALMQAVMVKALGGLGGD